MVNEEKPGLKPKTRQTVTGQLLDPRLLRKQHFKLCGSVRFTSCTLAFVDANFATCVATRCYLDLQDLLTFAFSARRLDVVNTPIGFAPQAKALSAWRTLCYLTTVRCAAHNASAFNNSSRANP
jgi:hypothetical protein